MLMLLVEVVEVAEIVPELVVEESEGEVPMLQEFISFSESIVEEDEFELIAVKLRGLFGPGTKLLITLDEVIRGGGGGGIGRLEDEVEGELWW